MLYRLAAFLTCMVMFSLSVNAEIDPLPSWNEGEAKRSILEFVQEITDKAGKNYVPPEERIATFDQDGTLWVEQPLYTQLFFALDRLKELAPQHPEWKDQKVLALLDGNLENLSKLSEADIETLVSETHAGITTEAYRLIVRDWLNQAVHPRYKRLFTELIYQPMLEVIQLLKNNGFKTYIVSGGGQEFIRTYAESVYGIPPEQIIGTAGKVKYEYQHGQPVLLKLPQMLLIDNYQGKPETINLIIGRRPLAAFGNSTGDRQMLEWTQAGQGKRLELLVHHDDEVREYAYGAHSKIGTFSISLMDEALEKKWIIVSMKNDWKILFSWQKSPLIFSKIN